MAKEVRNVDEINETLLGVSKIVLPKGLILVYRSIDELKEQDINAQSMPKGMFDQLVRNIEASGAPEGTPLLAKTERGSEIVSGHHRVRACRAAGVTHMLCFEYQNLDRSKIKAKQLAHNSINGTSDPELVKKIFESIDDVNARFEAFIDPRSFQDIKPVSFKPVDISFEDSAKAILIVFLPTQRMDFQACLEQVWPKTQVDEVYIAHREIFDEWIEAVKKIREGLNVVVVASAVTEMARLAVQRLEEIKQLENPDPEPAGAV